MTDGQTVVLWRVL